MNDELALLQALLAGDETAFTTLVEQYHASLIRIANLFVKDIATAEEVAQETWLAVLQGLQKFEGRSSLKTWIFSILTNKARTRGQRDKRIVPFSDMETSASDSPTVDPVRFNPASADEYPNHWATDPQSWDDLPETRLLSQEIMNVLQQAIASLPENQSAVVTLRDVHEIPSHEVCNILGISETNQRVLLHRARARLRQALEDHLKLDQE